MKKIKKEVKRFLIAGFSAVSTDLITYSILLCFLRHDFAKALSFVLGTIVAFFINKYWTFEKHENSFKEICRFVALYSTTLGANVMTNQFLLDRTEQVYLAFLIATGVSTILNFIGQKWWVFR